MNHKLKLQEKLAQLLQVKEKAVGDLNALVGAIQITQQYIAEIEQEEMNKPDKSGDEPIEILGYSLDEKEEK